MSLDVYLEVVKPVEVFSANITHNLNKMAEAAGIYKHLWWPEELGITKAGELIAPLKLGYTAMKLNPDFYRKYEPENKWGTYDNFIPWLEKYIEACEQNPEATVRIWR